MSEPPYFERLASQNLLTPPTLRALSARLSPPEQTAEPFLGAELFRMLAILCDRLRPPYASPTGVEIATEIDGRLASGKCDGWRYDQMLPDLDSYRLGLKAVQNELKESLGIEIPAATAEQIDEMILKLQSSDGRAAEWREISSNRFLEEVLAEVVNLAYSHPFVQSQIGYSGFADAKGYERIGLSQREEWEA